MKPGAFDVRGNTQEVLMLRIKAKLCVHAAANVRCKHAEPPGRTSARPKAHACRHMGSLPRSSIPTTEARSRYVHGTQNVQAWASDS